MGSILQNYADEFNTVDLGGTHAEIKEQILSQFVVWTAESEQLSDSSEGTYHLTLKLNNSKIVVTYTPDRKPASIPLKWKQSTPEIIRDITAMAQDGFKVVAFLSLTRHTRDNTNYSSTYQRAMASLPEVDHFLTLLNSCGREVSAFKPGVKLSYNVDTQIFKLEAKDHLASKSYHVVELRVDNYRKCAVNMRIANEETARLQATDKSHLPVPGHFNRPNFMIRHITSGTNLESLRICSDITVRAIAALQNDGSFRDASSPTADDVWFIIEASGHHLAVRDGSWYILSNTFSRIEKCHDHTSIAMTKDDHSLITAAINEWINHNLAKN